MPVVQQWMRWYTAVIYLCITQAAQTGFVAHLRGGASTRSNTYKLKAATSRWWTLRANSQYSSLLVVRNDHGKHWVWEPVTDMPLADYLAALQDLNKRFV
jgi:hypothetical protein